MLALSLRSLCKICVSSIRLFSASESGLRDIHPPASPNALTGAESASLTFFFSWRASDCVLSASGEVCPDRYSVGPLFSSTDEEDEERIFVITTVDLYRMLEVLESFLSGGPSLAVEEFASLLLIAGSACHDCLTSLPLALLSTTCSVGHDLDALWIGWLAATSDTLETAPNLGGICTCSGTSRRPCVRNELRSLDTLRLGGGAGPCLREPLTDESIVPTESRLEVLSLVVIFGPITSLGRRTSTVSPGAAYTCEFHDISTGREATSSALLARTGFSWIRFDELYRWGDFDGGNVLLPSLRFTAVAVTVTP